MMLLASIPNLSRAHEYPDKTLSDTNTTLSTIYGAQDTIPASPSLGNKGKDEMPCLTRPTTITTSIIPAIPAVETATGMVTLQASTTDTSPVVSIPHTRCANITIMGHPSGRLIACAPPSTITHTPLTSTSLEESGSEPTATATLPPSLTPPPPPPPSTAFPTTAYTSDPSADYRVSHAGKGLHDSDSGAATPTLAASPTSPESEKGKTGTGLPRFTLDPESTIVPLDPEATDVPDTPPPSPEPEPEPKPETEPSATSAHDAPPPTTTETDTDTEMQHNKDTAWSGIDGALPWQLLYPPVARREVRRVNRVQGISRAGAPHLEPAKGKRDRDGQPCEEEGEGGL